MAQAGGTEPAKLPNALQSVKNWVEERGGRGIALAAILVAPAMVLAHHGWSEYDSSKALKLTGKIVESGYEHPHGHLRLETPGKTWNVVLAPPSRMERRGLDKARSSPAAASPSRVTRIATSPRRCGPERITANGKTVELR